MPTKFPRPIQLAGAASAAVALSTGLLIFAGSSGAAAHAEAALQPVAAGSVSSHSCPAGLQPAFVGNVYTGQVGSTTTYSPQFCGPAPTPENPNPPQQYVHITAGSAGASVAKSTTLGSPSWTTPWVVKPNDSAVIPVQAFEMVGIANVASGTPGSITVTAITADG